MKVNESVIKDTSNENRKTIVQYCCKDEIQTPSQDMKSPSQSCF